MKSYAASLHSQWIKGTLPGLHPKSMTGYVIALKLRFEDKDTKNEAYADIEKVRYEGCIPDMFTKIQTFNDTAMVTGAALKKIILERLPQKILELMHTVDLTGKVTIGLRIVSGQLSWIKERLVILRLRSIRR
jgi:hypothetical protein